MTPTTPATPAADREFNLADWFEINSRWLTIGAVIVGVAALGFWFWTRSTEIKSQNAERALMTATASMSTGNAALASADLERIVNRWSDTRAGGHAALLLAQLHYSENHYDQGVKVLQGMLGKRGAKGLEADIQTLIGDGYAEQGKFADAAQAYLKAADLADGAGEKAALKAKAARAYTTAGKADDAKRIWEGLVDDPSEAVAAEARVRLGELTARPATKS